MSSSTNLSRRLAMLEQREGAGLQEPWHMVIIEVGEAYEDAAARYEADMGPIDDGNVIQIKLVAPTARLAA